MSLELKRRHGSPYWYARGTIRRIRIDESSGLADKKAAKEWLAIREAEIVTQSVHGVAAVKTFAHAAASYLEGGGEGTHVGPLLDFFGVTKLTYIDPDLIDRAAKKLGKKKDGSPKSGATINRQVHTPLAAILHHAAGKGWCPKPVVKRPKQPEGRVRWVSHDEADRMIGAAAEHLRPLMTFLFSTGARLSEALYLDWRDVDLEAGRVAFHETKNGESRGVPLHPLVLTALRELPHRDGAVFRRPDGKPYASREGAGGGQIKTAWATMLRNSGISDFRPHDTRHTWATWHYAANRDPFGLMVLGGWKSEKMVARYAHINPDHLAPTIGLIWGTSRGALPTNVKKLPHFKEAA